MFADPKVQSVYEAYEARAQADLQRMKELGPDGFKLRDEFLLPIGLDGGRLMHSLILAHKPKVILELGTSYGYSTLFLADAARAVGGRVITMELADYKQAHARDQLAQAGLSDRVDFRLGDAPAMVREAGETFDLVLIDIWKELYIPCLEAIYPKLSPTGTIVADNMIDPPMHREDARAYRAAVTALPDMQSVLLPVGSGMEVSCRWPDGHASL